MLSEMKRLIKRKIPVSYPDVIQIYLDSICNLDCWFCLYKDRTDIPQSFDINNIDKLAKAIKQAKTVSISAIGEPLMSRNLSAVLARIYHLNNSPNLIAMVTNGLLLSPDTAQMFEGHLSDLTISINSGAVKQVKSFMDALRQEDKPKIGLHFLAHAGNVDDIPDLIEIAKFTGIKRIRVDQFMAAKKEHLHLTLSNIPAFYNRMVIQTANLASEAGITFTAQMFWSEIKQTCISPWTEAHIWADGKVAPCCYNGSLFLGNAYQDGFEAVWFGEGYRELRKHPAKQCLSCPKILPFDDERTHIYPYLQENL
jgi:MoaA/NifB/PqqE/SkfB family radical SAM enzyme